MLRKFLDTQIPKYALTKRVFRDGAGLMRIFNFLHARYKVCDRYITGVLHHRLGAEYFDSLNIHTDQSGQPSAAETLQQRILNNYKKYARSGLFYSAHNTLFF